MTRGEIQSFIDGFIKGGGDPGTLKTEISDWMDKHPLYPKSKADQEIIVNDIESYRGVKKD